MTNDKGYLVEMSDDEYRSFRRLESSVNGLPYESFDRFPMMQGTDLSNVFKALNDLFDIKISMNKVKEYVNFLDNVFGGTK